MYVHPWITRIFLGNLLTIDLFWCGNDIYTINMIVFTLPGSGHAERELRI